MRAEWRRLRRRDEGTRVEIDGIEVSREGMMKG